MILVVLITFLAETTIFPLTSCNVFCSELFCQSYREQKGCLELSIGCQIQNETVNGELFPAAGPCNCCEVCLENIKEGEFCTIGSSDTAPPLFACGPGLYCSPDGDDYKCKKMSHTPCFKEQIDFDKQLSQNVVGSYEYMQRPKCDGDGNYLPIKCNPGQSCFCIDNDGKRIFGEAIHSLLTELTMKCECSRLNDKLSKILNPRYPLITARCLEDGSYDQLQCMGDQCLCVEKNSGSSASDTFNSTEVSFSKLPCFNNTIHRSWTYLHDCERILHEIIKEIQESEAEGFTVLDLKGHVCQPDGWFMPVQETGTHKYCVDKYGRRIGDFGILKNDIKAKETNCLCARTLNVIRKDPTFELPECCSNGNFKKIQCRTGTCYCVDENGLQTTKEVNETNIEILQCYTKGNGC